jgi:phenylalanyl-tRNA synthetase beta chain
VAAKPLASNQIDERVVLRTLAARGFQEAITFAFVDPALQRELFGAQPMIELVQSDRGRHGRHAQLAVAWSAARGARESAAPAATGALVRDRQSLSGGRRGPSREQKMLAAIALGARLPEQWGSGATAVDFYDLKGDLEALLALGGPAEFLFEPATLPCLHPGRSARIVRGQLEIGHLGELHPRLVRSLDLTYAPILFEVDFTATFVAKLAQFRETSRYPLIRRDISFTVPEAIAFRRIGERVSVVAASLLQELRIFDVYQGKGVETGRKSVALGLILQDLSRTLTDEEADRVVQAVRADLAVEFGRQDKRITSMALTKAEMAEALFNQLGLNKREARELVDLFFEEVRGALSQGEQVKLSGFGNFDLRDKNQRPGRNPKTGEEIPISARRVVTFRPGQKLKARVEAYAGTKEQ